MGGGAEGEGSCRGPRDGDGDEWKEAEEAAASSRAVEPRGRCLDGCAGALKCNV